MARNYSKDNSSMHLLEKCLKQDTYETTYKSSYGRFYPEEKKALPFERRQYSEEEMLSKFSNTAPVMSDSMEQVVTITPDNTETKPLREALPEAIKRLLFLSQFSTAC